MGALTELAPQYVEWVQNNPNLAEAVVIASALHAIGIQQGFEINPYQTFTGLYENTRCCTNCG